VRTQARHLQEPTSLNASIQPGISVSNHENWQRTIDPWHLKVECANKYFFMPQQQRFRTTETLQKQVDDLFAQWNRHDTPGCAFAIVVGGKLSYGDAFGMANIEHGIPITTKTVFDIGSDSKKFVALSIVLLARQGHLKLDDDISKFIPEMAEYECPVTIRHLLHHTSGMRDYFYLAYFAGFDFSHSCTTEEVIHLIAQQRGLNFKPGTEFQYSNSGYFLLAEIVKRVSGRSQRAFAEQHIFGPLGMKDTHFHDNHREIVRNRADGYSPKDGGGFEISMSTFDVVGASGVFSTVEDLCLWDANFYNNIIGGYGQDLIDEITTPGQLDNGEALVSSFGFNLTSYRGLKVVMHGGSTPGYQSQMIRFPEQDFTVICLSNDYRSNPTRICHAIADAYLCNDLAELVAQAATKAEHLFIDLPIHDLESKLGFFHGEDGGEIWDVYVEDGKLMVCAHEMGATFQIRPVSSMVFESVDFYFDVVVTFEESGTDGYIQLTACVDGQLTNGLQRVERVDVSEDELPAYCGSFHSTELDATYKLTMEKSNVAFQFKGLPKVVLQAINRTVFNCASVGLLKFTFDEAGAVSGLDLSAGRIRGIKFSKIGKAQMPERI
jgi:CubicO group peptidase (beta-lactamase class C family)